MELSRGASIARRNRKFLVGVKIGIKNHGGRTHQSFALNYYDNQQKSSSS